MYLPVRHIFNQLFFICLYLLGLLLFTTLLHLQHRLFNLTWRLNFKTAPHPLECPSSPKMTHHLLTYSPFINKSIWTVETAGRLGNQMGQYATLYALAKLNGHQAYIHPTMHRKLASLFRITLPVIPARVVGKICWRDISMHDWMSEDYRHIQGNYVRLTGYPCSYTFYHHIRQEILQEFTFHDHIKEKANRYLQRLRGRRRNVTYVGVHVRRGDYVRVMPQVWKGVVADRGYLEIAINYFREKYNNPIFVVISDGMRWCKKNIDASRGDVYFAGDGRESSPGRDFALLTHCNHTIMTIGTFGIWAGYLAGGETVYLANYTLPNSPLLDVFKPSAIYLPEWKGIAADLYPLLIPPPLPKTSLLLKSRSSKFNLKQKVASTCTIRKLWKGLCGK